MDEFAEHMMGALMMVVGSVSKWEETTDENLNDLESQLNTIGDAITYERELRQAALEDAGGADSRGDKNNATKV